MVVAAPDPAVPVAVPVAVPLPVDDDEPVSDDSRELASDEAEASLYMMY